MARREIGIGFASLILGGVLGFGGAKLMDSNASNQVATRSADVNPSASPIATPKPSEAAGSPLPKPSGTPDAGGATSSSSGSSSSTFNDYELKAGQSTTIKGFAIVQGDVIVDGVVLYDNNPKTGLVVEIDGGTHKIDAPFGADVQAFGEVVNRVVFDSTLGSNVGSMKEKGCDPKPKPGCDSVNVVKIGPVQSK